MVISATVKMRRHSAISVKSGVMNRNSGALMSVSSDIVTCELELYQFSDLTHIYDICLSLHRIFIMVNARLL